MALGDLTLEQLMELEIVSVSKRSELLSESPSAAQVITNENIRRSGASSIPEALRLASNLNVARQNSQEWIISSRGFSSDVGNKLLVMVDGRTVYTPLFSGVFWDRQDYLLEDIDRIEVISGPGGALWGANAVNGVINIRSKSAEETQGLYLESGGGTELQGFAGARYGGKLGDFAHWRVYGKYAERGSATLPADISAGDNWHMGQGGFRLDAEPSDRDTITLQGDYYGNEESLLAGGRSTTEGGNVLGRWTHTYAEDSDVKLQIYYDRTDLSLPVPAFEINGLLLAPAGTFGNVLDTADVDLQHRFSFGTRHRIVWGLGYRYTHDVSTNAPGLGFLPETLNQDLFSGFAQDEIALVGKVLYLTIGTKLEDTEYTGFEIEPSARLRWHITDRYMLWGAVSRAVRTPSRIDRDLSQGVPPFFVLLTGGDDFDSETVVAHEVGLRTQVTDTILISIAGFYNEYARIRSTSLDPVTLFPLFFENNVKGETWGTELDVNYQISQWWRLHGGYTFLEENIRVRRGRFDFNNALNETADPNHQFSLRSSMNLQKDVELDASFRWVDKLPSNNSGTRVFVPSYPELDIRLGWRPNKELELSIVGQNLLHKSHPEFGIPGPGRAEIERGVYGKIAWRY